MSKREEVAAILRQYKLGDDHEIIIVDAAVEIIAARIVSLFEHGHHIMTPPSASFDVKAK